MWTAKTLIRLGGSESSLGAQPFCWFCHVVAHFFLSFSSSLSYDRRHSLLVSRDEYASNDSGAK